MYKSEGSVGEPLITTGHQINANEAELSSRRETNIAKTSVCVGGEEKKKGFQATFDRN